MAQTQAMTATSTGATGATTGALMVGPGSLLYQAMSDMIDNSTEQMNNMLELEATYAQTIGGLNDEGQAILGKDGKPTYGCYGAQLDAAFEAANQQYEATRKQASGEIAAGGISAAGCGLGVITFATSGNRFWGESEKTTQLNQFKQDFEQPQPQNGPNPNGGNAQPRALGAAPANGENVTGIVHNKTELQEYIQKRADQRKTSTGLGAADAEKLQNVRDADQMANANNPNRDDSVTKNVEKLLQEEQTKDQNAYNSFTTKMTYIKMATDAGAQTVKGGFEMAAAEPQQRAAQEKALQDVISGTTQGMEQSKKSYEDRANSYMQQATQIAQAIAQTMRA